MAPDGLPDPLRVAVAVAGILDRLGVAYVTAGSFASSLHGEPRSTDDIDVVVRKLEWFRRGGETSERQWRDVVGVLRAQGARLDRTELGTWAERLGVADLL